MAMADWSALPMDAIEAISKRLTNGVDYLRFRSVCTVWRSTAPRRPRLPWHTVRFRKGEVGNRGIGLYDVSSSEVLEIKLPATPEPLGRRFCGPYGGWIPLLNRDPGISLLNPFTGALIRTPPFSELPNVPNKPGVLEVSRACEGYLLQEKVGSITRSSESYARLVLFQSMKVIISCDPVAAPDSCVVIAMVYDGTSLVFCRPRDDSWTLLQRPSHDMCFHDAIFFKDRFYAVFEFRVFACDLWPTTRVTEIPPADPLFDDLPSEKDYSSSYLVQSSGELLLVKMGRDPPHRFEVFRVDLGGRLRLSKLKSLGDRALFLGDHSFSLPGSSFSGCRGNCIYFIDGFRIASFNMGDGSISVSADTHAAWRPVHWITPSLFY